MSDEPEVAQFLSRRVTNEELYNADSISRMYTRESKKNDEEAAIPEEDSQRSENSNTLDEKASDEAVKTSPANPSGPPGPPQKVGLLHDSISHLRRKVALAYLKSWLILGVLIIIAFSIYWGALYDRNGHQHRLGMLVVIDSDSFQSNNEIGLIGSEIKSIVETAEFKKKGTWTVIEGRDSINEYFGNPENITEAIITKVHHRKFWSATYVLPNATYNEFERYKGISEPNQPIVKFIYETARDITSVTPYVVSSLTEMQAIFTASYGSIAQQLVSALSPDEKTTLIDSNPEVIATPPSFVQIDYRPYNNVVLLAPLQVGLIYLVIITFFLFNFFADIHRILLPHVRVSQYLAYRIIGNHLSFLITSLFICTVSAIYQVDFTKSFGRAGFVVYWISTYLTMAAVGGANENMALLAIAYNPLLLGCWLITFVILNVSPSFSPMALTSRFYRYGYIMPIYHSNDISKVILMGLWKGDLGMNYGVICAWIVLNTLLHPIILRHFGQRMAKKAQAAAAADAKQ